MQWVLEPSSLRVVDTDNRIIGQVTEITSRYDAYLDETVLNLKVIIRDESIKLLEKKEEELTDNVIQLRQKKLNL